LGLVYNPKDSNDFRYAMQENIKRSELILNKLMAASDRLINALNGNMLAGAAYTAARGLFNELIVPLVKTAEVELAGAQEQLNRYHAASLDVEGKILDEDNLKVQRTILALQRNTINEQISMCMTSSTTHANLQCHNTAQMYQDWVMQYRCDLQRIEEKIRQVDEDLARLYRFNEAITDLFKPSMESLAYTVLNS